LRSASLQSILSVLGLADLDRVLLVQGNDMRVSSIIPLGFMPGIIAQDVFEPADFNVAEALLDNGVNVSALPELSELGARSRLSGCSIIVSDNLDDFGALSNLMEWH
jgi:hypothetical protein